jgi:hypothetical protein
MKKKKYYYEHRYSSNVTSSELLEFYKISNVKLHKEGNKFYTYEFVGNEVSWFNFLNSQEVEIKEGVTKLPIDNKYANGYNWKTTGANARLRKSDPNYNPYDKLNGGKPPINPKTGRRDGGV